MNARLFHCPRCRADVPVVMRLSGYCLDCAEATNRLISRHDALLVAKIEARQAALR